MLLLQVRTLKQQNNALADEASSAKFKLVDAQQEQLKLKGQIVEVSRASKTIHLSLPRVACPVQLTQIIQSMLHDTLSLPATASTYSLDSCLMIEHSVLNYMGVDQ